MDVLGNMHIFVEVAERGSFTGAAERMNLSRGQVSKAIAQLETHFKARLLNRTTRKVSLSEVGRTYYERCKVVLEDMAEIENLTARQTSEPEGTLFIGAPTSFGILHLNRLLPKFLKRYPKVQVDIQLADRIIDIVAEGYDLVIRIAPMEDSSLIARKIAPSRAVFCASPEYLKIHGEPQFPSDLKDHNCLIYSNVRSPNQWTVSGEKGTELVKVNGSLISDNGEILHAATVAGLGITLSPTFIAGAALKSGKLQEILTDYSPPALGIYAIYPSRRYLSAKVRTFIDFLKEEIGEQPEWDNY
ncbi:MAG: Transcriptional regulator, LysR family [uncultured Thiotrichaceae bacterium]|uniref:Transcriptional regulator, LysR family n=1 Tax=uncultured Thiotrichaceae bacterium TaxID=298394 RepID=A0A6S6U662_9GAMM|nr:MAG: Transcriptional regulator, LysR family [uncultured Thiotrichaceae bacterium]